MRYVPLFLGLEGRSVAIVGAGEAALAKFRLFARTPARLRLFAERPGAALRREVRGGRAELIVRAPSPSELAGCSLVVVAEEDVERRAQAVALARSSGALVNVVDDPVASDVFVPAIVDRDPVVVAVGSEGEAPVLSRRIRARIEALLPEGTGRLARFAGRLRPRVVARLVSPRDRRAFWEALFDGAAASLVLAGREEEAEALARRLLDDRPQPTGEVVLLAVATDDPDLLTLGALDALQRADLLVSDPGIGARLLDRARRDAERLGRCPVPDCPETDHAELVRLLIAAVRSGRRVVRLVRSRARLETERRALLASGTPVRVLPGTATPLARAPADVGVTAGPWREGEELHA